MFQISSVGKLFSLYITFLVIFFGFITSVNNSALQGRQKLDAQSMRNQLTREYNDLLTQKTDLTSQSKVSEKVKGFMLPLSRTDGTYQNLNDLQDQNNVVKEESKTKQNTTPVTKPDNRSLFVK